MNAAPAPLTTEKTTFFCIITKNVTVYNDFTMLQKRKKERNTTEEDGLEEKRRKIKKIFRKKNGKKKFVEFSSALLYFVIYRNGRPEYFYLILDPWYDVMKYVAAETDKFRIGALTSLHRHGNHNV